MLLGQVKGFTMLPLYLYDHSGITMSISPFSCPWDSGQVGWIYCTPDAISKNFGSLSKENIEKSISILEVEVKYIMLQELSARFNTHLPQSVRDEIGSAVWERERTTLIKKTCHDPDQEWRMIIGCNIKPPIMLEWVPSGIILGLRTSPNDQKRIINAAKEAGIKHIYKSCIDLQNKLNFFPIDS